MKPADAIASVEGKFIVHEEIGMPVTSYGTDDSEHETGARNWGLAPTGERYVVLTSGGIRQEGAPSPIMFSDEERAWQWWYYAVLDYAETIASDADWPNLHLYWRERPIWQSAEYVNVDQAAALQRGYALHNYRLGFVYSRLVLSKLRPDGTEGP